MILILYFDKEYFKWSKPFLRSLHVHEPKAKVVIFGFDLTLEQITYLENVEYVLEVYNTAGEIDFWDLVCQKCWFVLETMRKYPGRRLYVITDVDMLIVNSLRVMKKGMHKCDVGLIVVSENKVSSGFLVFKETAKNFLNEYHNKVYVKGDIRIKKIEQKMLAKIYRSYITNDKLKFLVLSRKYIDNVFELDSFVWSAHKLNYGKKDTRLKLFSHVANDMVTGNDWKRYLKSWKSRMTPPGLKAAQAKKARKRMREQKRREQKIRRKKERRKEIGGI